MDPKDRAARRDRLRARAVTTTVVATVVAAPVLALWAAYRGSPVAEATDGHSATASEVHGPAGLDGEAAAGYENAGNVGARPDSRFHKGAEPDVSVEVISIGVGKGAGRLDVSARTSGDTTLVTLTATGSGPVRWSASTPVAWLYLSRSSGTIEPGRSLTIKVHVDPLREPSGSWSAQVAIAPAGAIVSIEGYGTAPSPSDPTPTSPHDPPPSTHPDPSPTASAPSDPDPSDPPSSPDPEPTPTGSAPSDPDGPTPRPSDGDAPGPTSSQAS